MYVRAWHSKTNTCPLRWSDKNIGLGVWLKALKPDTVAEDYTHSWYLHIRTLKPHCSSSQRLFPKQHQEDRNQSQARFTSFYNYYILYKLSAFSSEAGRAAHTFLIRIIKWVEMVGMKVDIGLIKRIVVHGGSHILILVFQEVQLINQLCCQRVQ